MLYCILQMFWNIVGANEARRDAEYDIITVRSRNVNSQPEAFSAA